MTSMKILAKPISTYKRDLSQADDEIQHKNSWQTIYNNNKNSNILQSSSNSMQIKSKQSLRLSLNHQKPKQIKQYLQQFQQQEIFLNNKDSQIENGDAKINIDEIKKENKKLVSYKSLQSTDSVSCTQLNEKPVYAWENSFTGHNNFITQHKNYHNIYSNERTQNLYNVNFKNSHLHREIEKKHQFNYKSVETNINFIENKRKELIKDLNGLKDIREKKTVFKAPAFLRDKVDLELMSNVKSKTKKFNQSSSIPKNFKMVQTVCYKRDSGIYKYLEEVQTQKFKKLRKAQSSTQKTRSDHSSKKKASGSFFKKIKLQKAIQHNKSFEVGNTVTLKIIGAESPKRTVTLKILKVLADNPGSSTFLVLEKNTKFIFCLKKSEVNNAQQNSCKIVEDQQNLNTLSSLIRESKIGMLLDHPYLIKTYCTLYDDRNIFQLMEFVEGSTLQNHNKQRKNYRKRFDNFYRLYNGLHESSHIRQIISQLVQGVLYLHENKIAHRDLKPANIFISNNRAFKIGDFGCSIYSPPNDFVGTLDYVAPQILLHNPHGTPVDMWAIGCIAYELFVGTPPFYHPSRKTTIQKIVKCSYDLYKIQDKCLRSFIESLLIKQPSKRLTASQALQHPLLKDYLRKKQQS